MKILLLGEYSALHKNLKDGLQALGHTVVTAGMADGFKNIRCDIDFEPKTDGLLGKIERRAKILRNVFRFKGYDVVQLINPFYFYQKYFPNRSIITHLKQKNKKFFFVAAGDDAYVWQIARRRLRYGPFDDFLQYDLQHRSYYMESSEAMEFNKFVLKHADGVIPVMYEYEIGYFDEPKRLPTIPLPINVSSIPFHENKVKNKIVIFHGLNRYGFKGTRLVEDAFEILKKRYPNDLELIIKGRLPLAEYLKLMQTTNVVIDQVYSHSLGMNGLYSLAMAKVTLGGCEPESLRSLGVETSPAINIEPNVDSIVRNVELLLDKRHEIPRLGYEGRRFVEEVHCHIKIAQRYVDAWTSQQSGCSHI